MLLMKSRRADIGWPATNQGQDVSDASLAASVDQFSKKMMPYTLAVECRVEIDAVFDRWGKTASTVEEFGTSVAGKMSINLGNEKRITLILCCPN